MGNFLHRTTLDYLTSTSPNDLPESLANYVSEPDMSPVAGEPSKYWKLTGDILSVMNQTEKDAVDAAELSAARDDLIQAEIDNLETVVRQVVIETVVQLNVLRGWLADFKTEVAAANNLAALKSSVAALPNMPDITFSQVKTKLRNGLGS